jgi:hypothetical protein
MKRSLLAAALAAMFVPLAGGCARAGSGAAMPEGAYVLTGKEGELLLQQCSRATPGKGEGTFQPDAADIAAMKAQLPRALAERGAYPPNVGMRAVPEPGRPDFAHAPQGWKRQFTGVLRGGKRYIYGNYFPASAFPEGARLDLASSPFVVCDGGAAFFGVEWDVDAKKFTHVAFNGFA